MEDIMRVRPRFLFSSLGISLVASGTLTALSAQRTPACDPDNGGLTLPQGFCALVVADLNAPARHIEVRPNGDIFVALRAGGGGRGGQPAAPRGVVALRDTTGDGKADVRVRFGPEAGGTGIDIEGDYVYFAPNDAVLRFRVPAGSLTPTAGPDTIVSGLPADRSHRDKSVAVRGNQLLVNIGAPSNSCQTPDRQQGVQGEDPCSQLQTRAGIWLFDASRTRQAQNDGTRYATGIRNAVGITIDQAGQLWAMQHGRDQLSANWPALYTDEQNAESPAEEFLEVDRGDDFGWPYCYYDTELKNKLLAPEYGGDHKQEGRCAQKKDPVYAFPGHWAPNALVFYTGNQFPAKYRNGVFVAFHGSWNRAPLPQQGFNVTFLPMANGRPAGAHEVFADGFRGGDANQARHRPTGLALGPDGSLYVTDDQSMGRIWRIVYRGD
jgi:glucose/arabinose dehydrogenase